MNKLGKWTTIVHAHSMQTGAAITPAQAVHLFGNPTTATPAAALLYSAYQAGWFVREVISDKPPMLARYTAVDRKASKPAVKPKEQTSYFEGVKRVSSVFELGEVQ